MDVGIFKVSGLRLKTWLIAPPLLMVVVGLGSYAWMQRAQWKLQQTKALSEVLPPLYSARMDAVRLFEDLGALSGSGLGSEEQLISLLQDMAQANDFMLDTVNIVDRRKKQATVPVLSAVVRGRGDFTSIQMYINEAKSRQQLLSVDYIKIQQPSENIGTGIFDVEIIFELLLLDQMNVMVGGM